MYATAPQPGYQEHDGFYLRLFLGFGGLGFSQEETDITISGVSSSLGLGGAVSRNLVIYGEVFVGNAVEPTQERAGLKVKLEGLSTALVGFGPGLAYYLPSNFYLSSTLAFARFVMDDEDPNTEAAVTNLGVGLNLMLGKEWWVSANWGLGLAGQLYFATVTEGESDNGLRWGAFGGGLVLSATYN